MQLKNWKCLALLTLFATLLCLLSVRGPLTADEIPREERTVEAEADVSDKVSVEFSEFLRVSSSRSCYVAVEVTNTSEARLAGPLLLVITETGLEGVDVDNADGRLDTNEPFVKLIGTRRSLSPGRTTEPLKISLRSKERLQIARRQPAELKAKVVRPVVNRQPRHGDHSLPIPPARASRSERGTQQSNASASGANHPAEGSQHDEVGSSSEDGEEGADEGESDSESDAEENQRRGSRSDNGAGPNPELVKRVMQIQDRVTPDLIQKEGVYGTATGLDANGDVVIRVYVERAGIRKQLPGEIDGVKVETRTTGRIRTLREPQDKRGQAGAPTPRDPLDDPQQRFPRPIPIGVSGLSERGPGFAGTLGCRVRADDGRLFILSNFHVLADFQGASVGDHILQPSPGDSGSVILDDSVGTLAAFIPLQFVDFSNPLAPVIPENEVDAAAARTTADLVGTSTPPGGYGRPEADQGPAVLGLKVQKVGRTTSYTTGVVSAVNVSVLVAGYSGGPAFFVNQIELTNPTGPPPGAPGDSGSLFVTNHGRQPVGLLFAGSALVTFANPIDRVLDLLSNEVSSKLTVDGFK